MKKDSIQNGRSRQAAKQTETVQEAITIGIDLGDKMSRYCALDTKGELLWERSVTTSKQPITLAFAAMARCRVALEVGTHSPWVSRLLKSFGHEVIVANARQVKLISESTRKDDRMDARTLARLARIDPELLRPVQHRQEETHLHLTAIRVRAGLVATRTGLINMARGLAKAFGERLPSCDADYLNLRLVETALPAAIVAELRPVLQHIESLTEAIKATDNRIEQIAQQYPETELLRQVTGVGPLIALTFVLTVEQPERFQRSRDVGCYIGLRPKRRDSGDCQRQLGISKEGDHYLRTLLVQGAHCILKRTAPDTDLKRWGMKLAGQGGKNARKRAIVAVARKLAILLHRQWVTGQMYEPLRQSQAVERKKERGKRAA